MAKIHQTVPVTRTASETVPASKVLEPIESGKSINLSTKSIAARLDASTGPELVISAMAHLELVKGIASSDRKGILAEMKNASGYYNANMSGNLSKIITTLIKAKRINDVGSEKYSLSVSEKKKVEAAVVNGE